MKGQNSMKLKIPIYICIIWIQVCSIPGASGKVINGNRVNANMLKQAIDNLSSVLAKADKSDKKYPGALSRLKDLQKQLVLNLKSQEKVDQLFATIISVDPELYYALDTIRDELGNQTDIFVEADQSLFRRTRGVYGITNIDQCSCHPGIYQSKFGKKTVSVIIDAHFRSLQALVHEFGHVRYQVANLRSYIEFYRDHYSKDDKEKGHLPHDPSHRAVVDTVEVFRKKWRRRPLIKFESHTAV